MVDMFCLLVYIPTVQGERERYLIVVVAIDWN